MATSWTETNPQMSLWPNEASPEPQPQQATMPVRRSARSEKMLLARRLAKDVICFWAPVLPSMSPAATIQREDG